MLNFVLSYFKLNVFALLEKGFEKVNVACFVANPVVKADVVAYDDKSKLIVFVVLVKGAEKVKAFSLAFKLVIVA